MIKLSSIFLVLAVTACTNTDYRDFSGQATENVSLIVAHKIIAKDSLPPGLRILPLFVYMAAPYPVAVLTDFTSQVIVNNVGAETNVTMLDKLDLEIYRQVSCTLGEKGYQVSQAGFYSWEHDEDWETLETKADFYTYLAENYQYALGGVNPVRQDAVLLVEYYMVLQDESVGDYLTELRIDSASLRAIAASSHVEPGLMYYDMEYHLPGINRSNLHEALGYLVDFEDWPVLQENLIPQCSNKSTLETLVQQELQSGSSNQELRAFLEKHEIRYVDNPRHHYFSGTFQNPPDLDTVDEPVNFEIYYDRKTGALKVFDVFYEN